MNSIIQRLRKEKEKEEYDRFDHWFEQGKKDGSDFAKSASYKELKSALALETTREMVGNPIDWENIRGILGNSFGWDPTRNEIIGGYFSDICEKYEKLGLEEPVELNCRFFMPNKFYIEWEVGWKESVETFWNEVKDKI